MQLIKENKDIIHKLIWKLIYTPTYMHRSDKSDIHEDLYQQAWVLILENIHNFDPNKGSLVTYIYHTLYNNLWQYYMSAVCPVSKVPRKKLMSKYTVLTETHSSDISDDFEDMFEKIEIYKRMYKSIKSSYRGDAAYDFIINNTDIEVISEYTGLKPPTVWRVVAIAREKVKKDLRRIKEEYDAI